MSKEGEPQSQELTEISREQFILDISKIEGEINGEKLRLGLQYSKEILALDLELLKAKKVRRETTEAENLGMIVKYWVVGDNDGVRYTIDPKGKMGLV